MIFLRDADSGPDGRLPPDWVADFTGIRNRRQFTRSMILQRRVEMQKALFCPMMALVLSVRRRANARPLFGMTSSIPTRMLYRLCQRFFSVFKILESVDERAEPLTQRIIGCYLFLWRGSFLCPLGALRFLRTSGRWVTLFLFAENSRHSREGRLQ